MDAHKLEDMILWAVNTSELYASTFLPIQRNLYGKYVKGEFDAGQALKAFQGVVPKVIAKHNAELAPHYCLSRDERQALANALYDYYTQDFSLQSTIHYSAAQRQGRQDCLPAQTA